MSGEALNNSQSFSLELTAIEDCVLALKPSSPATWASDKSASVATPRSQCPGPRTDTSRNHCKTRGKITGDPCGPRARGPRALFWARGPPGAPKGRGEASRAFLTAVAFIYVSAGSNGGLATPFVPDSAFSGISGVQTCLLPDLNCGETTGVRPKVAI